MRAGLPRGGNGRLDLDFLGWIGWFLLKVLGLAWSIVWFLLGGWIASLAQIGVIVLVIFGYKYGWRQAPREVLSRSRRLVWIGWAWARTRELPVVSLSPSQERVVRVRGGRELGDVNLSTLLNVLMLAGLTLAMLV